VAVRCQRPIGFSDQAMSVISRWYPHRFDVDSTVSAFDRVFRSECRSLVGGDRINLDLANMCDPTIVEIHGSQHFSGVGGAEASKVKDT
jgi:hypothetical protein